MPQRPTTHKGLHRAATGSVFALACALIYAAAVPASPAENTPGNGALSSSPKSAPRVLVKNEPEGAAHRSPIEKAGKLRAIPASTLDGESALVPKPQSKADKTPAKIETAPPKVTAGKPPADAGTIDANKSVKKKVKGSGAKQVSPVTRRENGLVPPPPPMMPVGMDVLGMYGAPVDYLSMKELEGRKKELSARFNELDSTLKDGERQIKERQERAQLFESLYQEGVVSRKELEVAKREAGEIGRDLKFKQDEFDSVKGSMKAVNDRLAVLKKMEEKQNGGKANSKKISVSTKTVKTDKKKAR